MRLGRLHFWVKKAAPIVGSLLGSNASLTKRRTREDYAIYISDGCWKTVAVGDKGTHTFPTAASPSRTSFTLLLGFGAAAPEESAIWVVLEVSVVVGEEGRFALRLLPTPYADSLVKVTDSGGSIQYVAASRPM